MRSIYAFDSDWFFAKTDTVPGTLPDTWQAVTLPHSWNAEDGQDGGNDYWRGTAMYCRSFTRPSLPPDGRAILEFPGAAMTADVHVNGRHLARHEGGFSTFRVDITDALAGENLLCVAVENSENDRVYPQKADFTFYGGLYRGVKLITVKNAHFELVKDGTPGIKVTPDVRGSKAVVTVETWQSGGDAVKVQIGDHFRMAENLDGHSSTCITIEDCHLWDGMDDPYLYTVTAALMKDGTAVDEVSARFGCRNFEVDPEKGFILNGRPYPLRGVSMHQDYQGLGNALTLAEHQESLAIIKELGANTLRLAHYQHAQAFYDLCDEAGLIVWAEIPYITQHMSNGRQNTLDQMRELITQSYNHPSIICWGLSNEITASSPLTDDLMENHTLLQNLCHNMDTTRPTVMAHAFMLEKESPLIPVADLGAFNLYFGWYLGELDQNDAFFDEYHKLFPSRCIGFSEYGADANPQYQSSAPEKGDYTETYQCLYHEHILSMIEARPWIWATHVWNLFDFGADGRDEGGNNGKNQKGLVTFDRQLKKDAFYLYKAAWSRDPFVHLCGRRYVDRPEEVTEVKVYSNQPEVALYQDGKLVETQQGQRVFVFRVSLTGEHRLTAKAPVTDSLTDEILIRKVEEENPAYRFGQKTSVVNWFDKEEFTPGYFSIRDKLGDLLAHPESAPLVNALMAKLHASRGDVAKEASKNPNLQAMLAQIPFQSLVKQAGDALPADEVRALNEALQMIKK